MQETLIYTLLAGAGLLLLRDFWHQHKMNKLKKDIWKKGYKDATDISSHSIAELLRKANERRRNRINNRDKKK